MKKIVNFMFVIICAAVIIIPSLKTEKGGEISTNENRYLASSPKFFEEDGKWNKAYFSQWNQYMDDNIGYRREMVRFNGYIQWKFFRNFEEKDYLLGKNDELFYVTDEMLTDYQHRNLRNDVWLNDISKYHQAISDYVESRGMQYYYMQCFDKHSIYPELFSEDVYQYGDVSKTDQIMESLRNHTTVKLVSCKETLVEHKSEERTFSHFGDASHWNPYGAHLGYLELMKKINENNENRYKILKDEEYIIDFEDQGGYINKVFHVKDMVKTYTIKENHAVQAENGSWENYKEDEAHNMMFYNPNSGNDTKVLIIGDSYIRVYLMEDIAQSFGETVMIYAEYLEELPEILDLYEPDIVIYECAERVNRDHRVVNLGERILSEQR